MKMWHEARKQERQIRTAMVDVKKRAERRKDFYDKIKQDPIRFLRCYGSRARINIDAELAIAAENPNTLMKWVGDNQTVIDRFDVRANLNEIKMRVDSLVTDDDKDDNLHERMCNYERYRCLVHNQFAKISESTALNRIEITEKFGEDLHKITEKPPKKKPANQERAAIGYVYEDTDYVQSAIDSDENSVDSEPDLDMDLDIELEIVQLSFAQQKELTRLSQQFGMSGNDYLKLMKVDKEQEEEFRTAKLLEEQKAQFHGRKSRRERKIFKEQRLKEKYLKQDPKTLTFGASVFHEELYVGKHLLTPSPTHKSDAILQKSSDTTHSSGTNVISRHSNLNHSIAAAFLNIPTIKSERDLERLHRSKSPTPSAYKSYKSSRRRSSSSNSYRRRYKYRRRDSSSYSKMKQSTRTNTATSTTTKQPIKQQSRSPELPLDQVITKKYYRSESESSNGSSHSSITSSKSHNSNNSSSSTAGGDGSASSLTASSAHSSSQIGRINTSGFPGNRQLSLNSNRYSNQHSASSTGNLAGNSNSDLLFNKTVEIPSKLNPKDLLKKQMELQLNKAYKDDKKAAQEKQDKVEKARMMRENQLKEMSQQLKKREKDKIQDIAVIYNSHHHGSINADEAASSSLRTSDVLRRRSRSRSTKRRRQVRSSSSSTQSSRSRSSFYSKRSRSNSYSRKHSFQRRNYSRSRSGSKHRSLRFRESRFDNRNNNSNYNSKMNSRFYRR